MRTSITIILILLKTLAHSQCYMDRHSTNWFEGWISCEKKASPNPLRGNSHWLQYNLGHRYILGKSHWWNHNVPATLQDAAKTIAIDYSIDGVNWTTFGTINLAQANGHKFYEGEAGPDFNGIDARYLLLTVLDNYGGQCASISEVKIDVELSTAVEDPRQSQCIDVGTWPNPFNQFVNLMVQSNCSYKVMTASIEDVMGRSVTEEFNIQKGSQHQLTTTHLIPGVYFIKVKTGEEIILKKIIKLQ